MKQVFSLFNPFSQSSFVSGTRPWPALDLLDQDSDLPRPQCVQEYQKDQEPGWQHVNAGPTQPRNISQDEQYRMGTRIPRPWARRLRRARRLLDKSSRRHDGDDGEASHDEHRRHVARSPEHLVRRFHSQRLVLFDNVVGQKERDGEVVTLNQVKWARFRRAARHQNVASLDKAKDGRHDGRHSRQHYVPPSNHEQQVWLQHGHSAQESHQLHRVKFGEAIFEKLLSLNSSQGQAIKSKHI